MVWSGSRPACLPLPFVCLPVLFIFFRLFVVVPGWLVSYFLSFVSHFFSIVSQFFSLVSQAGCLWSGSRLACLPLPCICLPILFICLPGHFLSVVSHFFSLSPRLGACGRVPGRLVSHFLSFVSHFFSFLPGWLVFHFLSFVSQARCLWSGSQPGCLPLPFICLPLLFICLPGWALALLVPCSISIHLSFRSVTGGVRPFPLGMQHFYSFVSRVCHWCCRPFLLFLFICLPCLSENSSAGTKPERQKERNHRGDK